VSGGIEGGQRMVAGGKNKGFRDMRVISGSLGMSGGSPP
jgi:hypothetical protein